MLSSISIIIRLVGCRTTSCSMFWKIWDQSIILQLFWACLTVLPEFYQSYKQKRNQAVRPPPRRRPLIHIEVVSCPSMKYASLYLYSSLQKTTSSVTFFVKPSPTQLQWKSVVTISWLAWMALVDKDVYCCGTCSKAFWNAATACFPFIATTAETEAQTLCNQHK